MSTVAQLHSRSIMRVSPESSRSSDDKARKASRRSLPKSRKGCGTCKSRRVKCDEEQPTCRRCRKLGVECHGYAPLAKSQAVPNIRFRSLAPKQYFQAPIRSTKFSRPEVLTGLHSGSRFKDQLEARYFKYYCNEIAVNIAVNWKSSIWDQIIPQAGESESFISHGIAALGALSLSNAVCEDSLSSHRIPSVGTRSNIHYQYGLKKYCKSLKMMRQELQGKIWGRSRISLIASLIIFCIESLMGNADSASIYASRSINLLCQWHRQLGISGNTLCAQDAFEAELYPAFPGLDLQALMHLDDRTKDVQLSFTKDLDHAIPEGLKPLTTVNQCVISCLVLLRRNLHFIAGWRLDSYPDLNKVSSTPAPHSISRWSVPLGYLQIPNSQRVAQKCYLAEIDNYRADLNEFLKISSTSDPIRDSYACTLCQIHTAMNTILLTGAYFPPRISWDSLLPEFQEIVTLCTKIYPQSSAKGGSPYSFDLGPIVPLAVVAIRCRDLGLKKRAVDLLLSKPGYREGIWDAEALGHVCRWVIEVEEEARTAKLEYMAGGLEGEGRLVKYDASTEEKMPILLMVQFQLNERKARAFCAVPDRGKAGMVLREKVVSW